MKVVIISNYWKNSDGGGMKTNIINFVEELQKRDNIQLYLIYREGEDAEHYRVNAPKFLFPFIAFLTLLKIKPDVINTREHWHCLLPGYLYKKLYPVKLIHTYHVYPGASLGLKGKFFYKYILNIQNIIDHCDRVTFVSRGMIGRIENYYGIKFKSAAVTHAGIKPAGVSRKDIDDFKAIYHIKNGTAVLLAHGLTQLSCKAEGAKLLISAVRKLLPRYPGIILILTREGQYSNELAEYVKSESLSENVILTGTLDHPEVPMALCDIYTHITLCDGVPISILEAMYMGKPIIATGIGGTTEAINDQYNGLIVNPNTDEIADKIELLLKDSELSGALGRNARRTAEEKFTCRRSVDNFIDIFYSG